MLKFIVTLLFAQVLLAAPLLSRVVKRDTADSYVATGAGAGGLAVTGGAALAADAAEGVAVATPVVGAVGGPLVVGAATIVANGQVSEHMGNTPGLGLEAVCYMNCGGMSEVG